MPRARILLCLDSCVRTQIAIARGPQARRIQAGVYIFLV